MSAGGATLLKKRNPFIATCAGGLEPVLEGEITGRGWEVTGRSPGALSFTGPASALSEANLTLRTASRILVPVTRGRIRNFDELYRLATQVNWPDLAPPEMTIGVSAFSSDRALPDTRFAALRVKDAIVDVQKRRAGRRSSVDRRNPGVGVVVYINDGEAQISLDSTGRPLHMRGYRTEAGAAPLRETVAAGIVMLSGWDGTTPFLDPFCGSGTIVIEAAMIAAGISPGSLRKDFAFLGWPGAEQKTFTRIAHDISASPPPGTLPSIRGTDHDADILRVARRNAERAGVSRILDFGRADFFREDPPQPPRFIVTNPPYGERMELGDAAAFARQLGDRLKQHYGGATAAILSGNRSAMKNLGLRPDARIPLFNGGLDSRLYLVRLFKPEEHS